MPKFSNRSRKRLDTCDKRLQCVMYAVIRYFDITIIEGYRNKVDQNKAFQLSRSRVKYPHGKHNKEPSQAVDVAPWIQGKTTNWNDTEMFHYMAGRIMATADSLGIKLRWGADWNRNQYSGDEKFLDMVHFELDE